MAAKLNSELLLNYTRAHKSKEWEKLEKILLTIVGGTLAASSTFLTGEIAFLSHYWILKTAWVLLSCSLITLLLSYAFCELLSADVIAKLRKAPEVISQEDFDKMSRGFKYWGTTICNYLSLGLGITGMIALVAFAYVNIPDQSTERICKNCSVTITPPLYPSER